MSSEEDIQGGTPPKGAKEETDQTSLDTNQGGEQQGASEAEEPARSTSRQETQKAAADTTPPPTTAARNWPGTVALILALMAMGVSGWMGYQQFLSGADHDREAETLMLEEQAAEVSELRQAIEEIRRRDEDLASAQQSMDAEIQRMEQRSDSREAQLGALEQGLGRVDERSQALTRAMEQVAQTSTEQTGELADLRRRLEAAIEQMDAAGDMQREIDRELRRQMLLLEAVALLRVGQDIAELQADWQSARRVFERARDRLGLVEDARLEPVRRALAREIEALNGVRSADLNAELARLQRMARESRTWPLQLEGLEAPEDSPEEAPAGWRERVGERLGALVQVERRDELGRDEGQFEAAREQVQLRLLAAELALIRRDKAALDAQLDSLLGLLDEWFQAGAAEVESARAELGALKEIELTPSPPELGAALNQLQSRLGDS